MNNYLHEYDTVIPNKRDEAYNPLFYKFYLFFFLDSLIYFQSLLYIYKIKAAY